jgi:hypothetical protein
MTRWLGSKPDGKTDAWRCANDDDLRRKRIVTVGKMTGNTRKKGEGFWKNMISP